MAYQVPLPSHARPTNRVRKRLIVLCDGTWQDSTSDDQTANPTNVTRFARALSQWVRVKRTPTSTEDDVEQIVYYQKGVGSGILDRLIGGATGIGVSANVRAAYGFLANNYDVGDEIFFIGFSRGAYTTRAIAGLVAACGLLTKKGMDSFPELYNLYYKEHGKGKTDAEKAEYTVKETAFLSKLRGDGLLEPAAATAIEAVGVWDTVAFHQTWFSKTRVASILGIEPEKLEFHNAELSPKIRFGFHALALDETRDAYRPTLWQMPKNAPVANGVTSDGKTFRLEEMKQVWFSGKHSDCGGGYSQTWLSNITLGWMVTQFEKHNLLAFDQDYLLNLSLAPEAVANQPWETSKGNTKSDTKGFDLLVDKLSRTLPLLSSYRTPLSLTDTNETIHSSIEDRKFGHNTGSKGSVSWPCGALTGDRDGEKWLMKGKAEAYLTEEKVDGMEQTFRGRVRAPFNPCIEALHLHK